MDEPHISFSRSSSTIRLWISVAATAWLLVAPAAADVFTETYYFTTGGISSSDVAGNSFKDRSPGKDLLPYTADDEDLPTGGNTGGTWSFADLDNDGDGVADRVFSCTRRDDDDTLTLTSYSEFEHGVIAEGEDWIDLHEAFGRGPSGDGTLGVDTGDDFEWNDRPNWETQSNWMSYNNLAANQRGLGGSRYYFEHRNGPGQFDEIQEWKKLVNLQTNADDPRTADFNERHSEYARGDNATIKGLLIPLAAIPGLQDGELDPLFGWYEGDMAGYVRDVLGPKLEDPNLTIHLTDEGGNACGRTRSLLPPTWLMIEQGEWNVRLWPNATSSHEQLAAYWGIVPREAGSLETDSVLRWSRIMLKGDDESWEDQDRSWNPPIRLVREDNARRNVWRREKFTRSSVNEFDPLTGMGTGLPDRWGGLLLGCGIPTPDFDNTPPDSCWFFFRRPDKSGLPYLEDCQKDWELTLPGGSGPQNSWFEMPLTQDLDAAKAPVRAEAQVRVHPRGQRNRIQVVLVRKAAGDTVPVVWVDLQDRILAKAGVGGDSLYPGGPVQNGKELTERSTLTLAAREGVHSLVELVFNARAKQITVNLDGQDLFTGSYADFDGSVVNGLRVWTESGAGPENQVYVNEVAVLQDIPQPFIRGDVNCDGRRDIADAVASLNFQFLGGDEPCCMAAVNVNNDASVNIADPIAWLSYSFLGGDPPEQPFPHCGVDWNTNLSCDGFPGCP